WGIAPPGDKSAVDGDREAAVGEVAERVELVEPAVHVAGLLAPGQGRGGGDAPAHLEDPAPVHPVLGPRPREVLDARHLDPGDVAGGREPPHPVAVGVAGEVADDAGT